MIPSGLGTLGPALPLAIGGAVGRPDAPSVCVIGDGGLLFTIGEMAAAAARGQALVMILWNNGGYGEMRDEMGALSIPPIGTDGGADDFLTIAKGFGWTTHRPPTLDEVESTLAGCESPSTPTLIELTPELLA
jgi:acetolactate synthase-1/2/3 large subunit